LLHGKDASWKGSKKAYQEFSEISFFEKVVIEGLSASEYGPRIMPLTVWSLQDLSSMWKSFNTGGGANICGEK
jgi:hypothetical protein